MRLPFYWGGRLKWSPRYITLNGVMASYAEGEWFLPENLVQEGGCESWTPAQ